MEFNLSLSIEVLSSTPITLQQLLAGKDEKWTRQNEGGDSWSPYDVVGHLLHGEKTDWMERLDIVLAIEGDKTFSPFDRFAQFKDSVGKSMEDLLQEFASLRRHNLDRLKSKNITAADLEKEAIHPALGKVTLRNLLATWVVHDLNHLAQIARVMAKQYKTEVGPWEQYLRILN